MNTAPIRTAKRIIARIFVALFLGWAVPVHATAANLRIVLDAEKSTGGRIITSQSGDVVGVTLDRSCEANFKNNRDARIEWTPDAPLPVGWWRGVVESNFTGGYANRNMSIMMVGGQNPAVRVDSNYVAPDNNEPQRLEFWIHTSEPSESVRIQPRGDLWRYNNTWPVSRIILEHVRPDALTATDAITLELPVAADGSVVPPQTLPTGNWSLGGYMRKEGEAIVEGEEGRPIRLTYQLDRWRRPGTYSAHFHLSSPLVKINIPTASLFQSVILQHRKAKEATPIPVDGRLAITTDATKTITGRLEMIGSGLTGEVPVFPLLPQGKKTVVLTSWDDGKPEDLRCAEILTKHGYRPTFMLNGNSPALQFLDKLEALNAEIGSHGYHHTALSTLSPERALENCASMRLLLENKVGHPVISFSFPDGYFPAQDEDGDYVLRAVRDAGYWSGRTQLTKEETVDEIENPLIMNSIGLYGSGNKMLEAAWPRILEKEGGVFYLKGHSWQIGKTDAQWKKFEDFIAQFAGHPDAWYPSLGEFSLWLWARENVRMTVETLRADQVVVELARPWLHPYLAAQCPLSLQVPAGVVKVLWQGRELPVVNGRVELTWL